MQKPKQKAVPATDKNSAAVSIDIATALNDDTYFDGTQQRLAEPDNSVRDESMMFFVHYVGVCVLLVLTMVSLLDPYAVVIGLVMAIGIGVSVWVTVNLAEMFNEHTQSRD